jgi:glucan phosphorylase
MRPQDGKMDDAMSAEKPHPHLAINRQRRGDKMWRDQGAWSAACARNIAGMGWLSADRVIGEYAKSVCHARF